MSIFSLLLVNILVFLMVIFARKKQNFTNYETFIFLGIWIVHLGATLYFHFYILNHGGDSSRYWSLTADQSQAATSWMQHFGFSTFFIQWLNYIPSKLLGLNYFTGNLIYSFLSFVGLGFVFLLVRDYRRKYMDSSHFSLLLFLPLFFPNLHFWTAGVSKEALLFLGLGLYFRGIQKMENGWGYFILGFLLCLMIRPLIAFFLLLPLLYLLLLKLRAKLVWKSSFLVFLAVLFLLILNRLKLMAGMEDISFQNIQDFSHRQFDFLDAFGANTRVDMLELSWPERLWTVIFRPVGLDFWSFDSFIVSMENNLSFIIVVSGLILGIRFLNKLPFELKVASLISLGIFIIHTFVLNNLGLMARMKSIWIPFIQMSAIWLFIMAIGKQRQVQKMKAEGRRDLGL
ncbi:hypothetical protein [Algoriphagus sp. CAU 1675]|uniref:hypothetical protein n=1 Tax=Algoriphagus sp. CAU 1675 TaxID=3032597 RepID=UPI0023DCAE5B|nr:hypothetical protein [Algoriphagus sp. CAU 1675]MDF2159370.1 hypothetical protein [Algoriphagus sp. CAU 1675]